jgi:hypothetical protein
MVVGLPQCDQGSFNRQLKGMCRLLQRDAFFEVSGGPGLQLFDRKELGASAVLPLISRQAFVWDSRSFGMPRVDGHCILVPPID